MGMYDRDWYRGPGPSHHSWHDMPGWAKLLAVLIGLGLLATWINSARYGAPPYYDDYYDEEAMIVDLFDAVQVNSLSHAEEFLEESPQQIELRDELTGAQPLHHAAIHAQAEMIGLLVKHGADVDAADDTGRTPLHYASHAGNVANARALLAAGAEVNARDDDGSTPLLIAASSEGMIDLDVVRMLRDHGAEYELRSAAMLGDEKFIAAQLKADAGLLREHPDRDQMLVDAIEGIQREALRRYIKRVQENPTSMMYSMDDRHPYGPDMEVIAGERLPLVKLLIKHGADVNGKDADLPPLIAAAGIPNAAIVKLLLDHGAKVNIRHGRRTPLKVAIQMQNDEVERLLRKHQD